MSDEYYQDPSGDTEAFRTFAQSPEPATAAPAGKLPLAIGGVVAAVVLVALVAWLVAG
jgi:hypothetical protein